MRAIRMACHGPPAAALFMSLALEGVVAFMRPFYSTVDNCGLHASQRPAQVLMMAKQAWTPPENEFSRTISLDDVGYRPVWMRMKATQSECDALAERFEFINLKNLAANVSVTRPQGGTIVAEGSVVAELDRACAATGEIFPYQFSTTFKTYIKEVGGEDGLSGYLGSMGGGDDDDEEEIDEDMYDDEVDAGGVLDVGEIAAQYLYLNMEPYVTMPGKTLGDMSEEYVFELDEPPESGSGGGGKKKKPKPTW